MEMQYGFSIGAIFNRINFKMHLWKEFVTKCLPKALIWCEMGSSGSPSFLSWKRMFRFRDFRFLLFSEVGIWGRGNKDPWHDSTVLIAFGWALVWTSSPSGWWNHESPHWSRSSASTHSKSRLQPKRFSLWVLSLGKKLMATASEPLSFSMNTSLQAQSPFDSLPLNTHPNSIRF